MYRLMLASSGSYYVQEFNGFEWKKVGGFFKTRTGARQFYEDISGREGWGGGRRSARIIEYLN